MHAFRLSTRRGQRLVVICIGIVALISTGCGSSGTSSGSVGAGKSPVKIGFPVNLTGTDTQYPDALAAAKAAVRGINARGGIKGHPVVLDWCDVQSSVDVAEACARKMVADKVIAVTGDNTNYGPQMTAILQAANIPETAGLLTAASQYSSPIEFPRAAGGVGSFVAGVAYGLKIAHLSSFAFVGVQIPIVASLEASTQSAVVKHGGVWKGNVEMPVSTTAMAPYVAAAEAKHADIVYLAMSGQQVAEFALAAEAAGYSFHTYVTAIAYTNNTIQSLRPSTPFAKAMLFGGDLPPNDATSEFPILKQFNANMAAEASSGDKYAGAGYSSPAQLEAWYAVHVVQVIADTMSGSSLTSTTMLAAFKSAKNVNLGLQPPWTPNALGPSGFPRINTWDEYMERLVNGRLALAYPKSFDVEPFATGG